MVIHPHAFFPPENSLERVIQQALWYITVPPNNLILSNINIVDVAMMFVRSGNNKQVLK